MLVIWFLPLTAVLAPLATKYADGSLTPTTVNRFARWQQLDVGEFNGGLVLGYLRVTQRWKWIGLAAGLAWTIVTVTLSPFPFVVGWLFGIVAAEIGFGRGQKGRPIGIQLAPTLLVVCWRIAAAVGCALAVATVARSFRAEVGVAERLAAVTALGATLAVHLLVRSLQRRPLHAGPADLVGAEVAVRSSSARKLLALGAAVTLWTGLQAAYPQPPHNAIDLVVIVSYGLPVVAWVAAASSWQARPARESRTLPWVPIAAVPLAVAAFLVPNPVPAQVQSQPGQQLGTLQYARLAQHAWEVGSVEGYQYRFTEAATYVARRTGLERPAPFALSGNGSYAVYLDDVSRRMVRRNLETGESRFLTGKLADDAVPEPVLSADGSYVTLTDAAGTDLIDMNSPARVRMPGVRYVLGIGPDSLVVTTGRPALPGTPDTELRTVGHDGTVRTRVPYDPTLRAWLAPDARTLVTVTGTEVVSMDARTGHVTRRRPLGVRRDGEVPEPRGWSEDGKLLVTLGEDGYLVDPATGRSARAAEFPEDAVVGKVVAR
ncbi:hypothetical protein [Nonomuraea sediminis]|uniref:hypothetical protein n=1 Tax=Nonomuraea sediminis TaxID=2835864 RepID=UPI001BDBBD2F|nr:hypothetical protein [Nonomuraea sediminis]